jgi:hypothetical protein
MRTSGQAASQPIAFDCTELEDADDYLPGNAIVIAQFV